MSNIGRSIRFPTHYRVGSVNGCDVYWHPQFSYAVERASGDLEELRDTSQVTWFDMDGDLNKIVSDLQLATRERVTSVTCEMYKRIRDATDDVLFAEECEREKAATLRNGSGVY